MFDRLARGVFASIVSMGVLGTALLVSDAQADTVSYQGFLQDDGGSPLPGPVDLSFRIYAAATGGSALWAEGLDDVALDEGVFTVLLGQTSPLTETLFNGSARWIETSVDGAVLAPRRPFTSVPYSMYANIAETALNGPPDDDWTIDGEDIYRVEGNIGIGTPRPLTKLHVRTGELGLEPDDVGVNSTIILESTDANLQLYSNSGGQSGSAVGLIEIVDGSINDAWTLARMTSGSGSKLRMRWARGGSASTVMTLLPTNRVGIGTESPTNELSVAGDVDASTYQATAALDEFNAPLPGGVYRDNVVYAWAYVRGDGIIVESFGIDSVQRTTTGAYSVNYETQLSGASCPMVMAQTSNDPILATVGNFGPTGCAVRVKYDQGTSWAFVDNNFFIQVVGRP